VQEWCLSKKKQAAEGAQVQYPLSRDEHAAMARRLADIRKQLQDVSELFAARYGKESRIAEKAVEATLSSTMLEHELLLEREIESVEAPTDRIATGA
jgi:hypothetical protein